MLELRPIRPAKARRDGVSLQHQPASTRRVHLRCSREDIAAFVGEAEDLPPEKR